MDLFRRTPFTFTLIFTLLAVFVVEVAQSSPDFWLLGQGGLPPIAQWGVVWAPAIGNGEWWRLMTAGFLHLGLLHIGLNVYALVIIGGAAEMRFGWWKTAVIFFAAVIGGDSAAMVFQPDNPTLGASGGVLGLAGAIVLAGFVTGEGLARSQWVISAIVMTLAFGFFSSGISNAGHIGGLFVGTLVSWPMSLALPKGASGPRYGTPRPGRQPVNKREIEFQRRIDEAMRRAAEERAREKQ